MKIADKSLLHPQLAAQTPADDCELTERVLAETVLAERWYFRIKPWLDRGLAALLLIPGLPMMGFLILLIRASSRGPGVYRQVRVGQGGKNFTMYKLRSMRLDAEAKSGPAWSASGADPRVTRLGYWLRRLHLDELPQLFNVLRGEMALVGPRPERPEFVKVLARQIPGYMDRLSVLPGVTGLAQINLPPDSDLDSVRRKLIVDVDYILSAGFWLDFRILFCTILRMLWIKGPAVTRAIGLERLVFLPATSPSPATNDVAVSVATLSMSTTETVVDFRPAEERPAARRDDESRKHLHAAAPAVQDA
jgi:lipopolysaccharide/colanic/teichoic acid biosynthesis glycosyltransferase